MGSRIRSLMGSTSLPAVALAALAVLAAPLVGRGAVAQQPAAPPQASAVPDPKSPEVYNGWKFFHVYCYRCHGTDAIHNEAMIGPDLRISVKNLSMDDYVKTVKEGRLAKGMPAWGQLLTDKQIADLHLYLEARSAGVLKPGRPDEQ